MMTNRGSRRAFLPRPGAPGAPVRTLPPSLRAGGRSGRFDALLTADTTPELTHVEVLWIKQRVENRIRFGRADQEHVVDRYLRVVSFAAGSIFAFVRWAANDYGTVLSRIDILRAVAAGERYVTVPHVRPGGEILLRISGWPGREGAPGDRDHRSPRHRSCRRSARPLAARPQQAVRRRPAASLYAWPA
jgi:hypothetical protein